MKKLREKIQQIKVSQKAQHIPIIEALNMICEILDKRFSEETDKITSQYTELSAMEKAEAIKKKYEEKEDDKCKE